MFHMRALYVGKGSIPHRLQRHWANQPTAEQLILDTYNLPFNRAENPGTANLCAYFDQAEVD